MATSTIKAKSTDIVEDISSSVSYGTGVSSTDFGFSLKRMGKLVILSFTIANANLLPSASWGNIELLRNLPYSSNSRHSRISGMTVNSNIPFCFNVEGGVFRLDKLNNSTSSDSMPNYFGGIITYFAN